MRSTSFQTALAGGRISRMPFTALIMDTEYLNWESRPLGWLFPVGASRLDVMAGVQAKTLALLFRYLPLDLGRHAHRHATRRNFRALRHNRAGRDHRTTSYLRAIEHDGANSDKAVVLNG